MTEQQPSIENLKNRIIYLEGQVELLQALYTRVEKIERASSYAGDFQEFAQAIHDPSFR